MTTTLDQERLERAFTVLCDHVVSYSETELLEATQNAILAYLGEDSVVVPREPTDRMVESASDTFRNWPDGDCANYDDLYRAMLAASQGEG